MTVDVNVLPRLELVNQISTVAMTTTSDVNDTSMDHAIEIRVFYLSMTFKLSIIEMNILS